MNWLISIGVSVLSGIFGLASGLFLGAFYVRWFRVSSFEGGSGYANLGIGLLGGLIGLVVGLIAARSVAPGFLKELGCALGSMTALALVVTGICYALADIPPKLNGHPLALEVEIKLPVGATNLPSKDDGESHLAMSSISGGRRRAAGSGSIKFGRFKKEDGRWIVPGRIPIFTQRGKRGLEFKIKGEETIGFLVPLPARPGKEFQKWSEWGPRPPAGSPPWPDSKPSYRFRVTEILPPPPGPSPEEIAARREEKEQAKFDAIPEDAPILQWLPYTRYGVPEQRTAVALQRIAERPEFVEEWSSIAMGADGELAGEVLRLVPNLPEPAGGWTGPLRAVGQDIIERIRRFNATTPEQDPSYEGAADVSRRFSPWHESIRLLRERHGLDLTSELKTVLELSRVRTDSHCMQQDVRRVASYYMKEWAGLEPMPGDPKPR